ncbi:pickpocket protein 28-like [Coccinella septempunctata]|uniref:pickpocket protein 28-like n=1 Tax=Coccinella septempunctata TaxID=41139 RepID=UPI001D0815EF|nr:pickpocket protein 28-like [Coccinella septempunctata]
MEMRSVEIEETNHVGSKNAKEKTTFQHIKTYLKEYCDVSSIQGLSYLTKDDNSLFERCWWTVVFLCCLSGCTYMIYEVCKKWVETPVLVSLATKDTPIHKVPFPAVTICPESKISRSCVNYSKVLRLRKAGRGDEVSPLENEYFDNMALLCRASNYGNSSDNDPLDDYSDFLDKCKSVTLENSHCKFGEKIMPCDKLLQPIITDEGLCYTFNMFDVRDIYSDLNRMKYFSSNVPPANWDVDDGYPDDVPTSRDYPVRVLGSGNKNSLVVVLLTKKTNVYYSCRDFSLQGMRVTLHMPARIPRPNQVFFPVGLNELVYAQVTPTLMGTTPKIRDYGPHKRNCFFGKERKLRYFKLYTQSNCNLECWTNYTIQECGCVHFYMPRDARTSICPISKRSCLQTAAETYAVSDFPQQYHQGKQSKGNLTADCDCLPICSDLNYNAETSRGKWNWDDPNGANVGDLKKYFVDHYASAVKINFKSTFFLPTEKSELYGIVDFLSNTGGILGLFTGFSLVSLVEIIYFMSIKLIANYKKYGYWAGRRDLIDN